MSPPPRRTSPVTVTQLPIVRCDLCRQTLAHRAGTASEVLTEHYLKAHPEVLGQR